MTPGSLLPTYMSTGAPPSPLTFKKRRLDQEAATFNFVHYSPPLTTSPMLLDSPGLLTFSRESSAPSFSAQAGPSRPDFGQPVRLDGTMQLMADAHPALATASLQGCLQTLEVESHAVRAQQVKRHQDECQTGTNYNRHVQNYKTWWAVFQARRLSEDPSWVNIPVFPVTATKVAFFLEHETTREKRKQGSSETLVGSNVGKSHISQVISALEDNRRNTAHLHKDDPDAQQPLRSDIRIRAYEKAAKQNEPKRIETSQALKAAGSSADTYTTEELKKCAQWCLTDFSGPRQVFVGIRDRAMLLLASVTAFRGESSRILQWSDLFMSELPLYDVREGFRVPVLAALADNAKHNQQGRLDEHGALRHREVELCPVGAVALLFFANFHILCHSPPSFSPDLTDTAYGQYGRREWYTLHVFWAKGPTSAMSYDNHRERLKLIHARNDVAITKVTHATRSYAAQTARAHGATVSGTKALGGWNENGSFRQCYERTFPVDALLGAAMFNGKKPETYSLPRGDLEPPTALLNQIFPWLEAEERAFEERVKADTCNQDFALRHFFRLLKWLRIVLIQDASLLVSLYPNSPVFRYAPFNTPEFHAFASTALPTIRSIEEQARRAYENLPGHLVQSLHGVTTGMLLEQQQQREEAKSALADMAERMVKMEGLLNQFVGSKPSRRKRKIADLPDAIPPAPVLAMPPAASIPFGITINLTNGDTKVTPVPTASSNPPAMSPAPLHEASPAIPSILPSPAYAAATTAAAQSAAVPLHATKQEEVIKAYGEELFYRHSPWIWKGGNLVPTYQFQAVNTISDVWEEWVTGRNGFLSVRELTEKWGNAWRHNNGTLKTEGGRRMKIVNLVTELAAKPRWDTALALRFLKERYGSYRARSFADFLTRGGGVGRSEVLAAAHDYP